MSTWQLQEAKAEFSEVVRRAETEPQEYLELVKPKSSFLELMQSSPFTDTEIEIEHDHTKALDIRKPNDLMDYVGFLGDVGVPDDVEESFTPEIIKSMLDRE